VTALRVEALTIAAGERVLVENLCLSIRSGEFLAILGRNGSGKTLTLQALAGLSEPRSGQVYLDDTPLRVLGRRRIARRLGLLPQDREESLSMSALESVLIGRHPHLKFWQREGARDLAIAHAALERLGLAQCAHRAIVTLSGGEQRRTAMAALLAQQPQVYLLDEPSNHLDPHHQIQVLSLFGELCADGACIVATLHDPALADRFAHRVLLLHGDGRHQTGPTPEVLNSESLSALYLTPIETLGSAPRRAFLPG
jgi:iron complex transport system ATP-binding protein